MQASASPFDGASAMQLQSSSQSNVGPSADFGAAVGIIGHPAGLPLKLFFGDETKFKHVVVSGKPDYTLVTDFVLNRRLESSQF